jgi:hypothetical protein
MPEICCLDRVVSMEVVRDPVFTIIVSSSSYLHFVSYAMTLASFCTISLDWRRLSSCVLSWVWSVVSLDLGSVGCIVNDITNNIGRSICWSISRRVCWSISCNVSSEIDRLHYFVFTSSFFSH